MANVDKSYDMMTLNKETRNLTREATVTLELSFCESVP